MTRLWHRLWREALWCVFRFDRWHICAYARPYADATVRYINTLPKQESAVIVDLGCGIGDVLLRLRGGKLIGLDRSQPALNAMQFRALIRGRSLCYGCEDVLAARLPAYDVAVCLGVLERVPLDAARAAVANWIGAAKPGGRLIVSVARGAVGDYPHQHCIEDLLPAGYAAEPVWTDGPHLVYVVRKA